MIYGKINDDDSVREFVFGVIIPLALTIATLKQRIAIAMLRNHQLRSSSNLLKRRSKAVVIPAVHKILILHRTAKRSVLPVETNVPTYLHWYDAVAVWPY